MRLQEYYRTPAVQSRMIEFLGGTTLEDASCMYLVPGDGVHHPQTLGVPLERFREVLEQGQEVARSLWDESSLIADLDIEYVNFDRPMEVFEQPRYAFSVQRPVIEFTEEVLLEHGIAPLHLISGRGHHFLWRIPQNSPCFQQLAELACHTGYLLEGQQAHVSRQGKTVPRELRAAFSGLGMVMEYLGHRIVRASAPHCPISVQLTAVEAGPPGHRGREVVSIDLSEYGDPLHHRTVRIPFGAYLKLRKWDKDNLASPMVMIPHHEVDEEHALDLMRDLSSAAKLARRASVQIPEQADGTARLLANYQDSELRTFHKQYYSQRHTPFASRPQTYDGVPAGELPLCVRRILEHPNDWLLKPAAIQLVVRTFLARGWHPRSIAGLILSQYERDHGWQYGVHFTDATSRADFYTRLFAGMVATSLDDMIDMNCCSTREKGYCFGPCQGDPLLPLRDEVRRRRQEFQERGLPGKARKEREHE